MLTFSPIRGFVSLIGALLATAILAFFVDAENLLYFFGGLLLMMSLADLLCDMTRINKLVAIVMASSVVITGLFIFGPTSWVWLMVSGLALIVCWLEYRR